ncbi:hypothetical protein MSG28_003867 [Choristoneura fumiferana]|uniref:Uncharacterized protein n=1 Tax=Choristoneura fumiferana TaxID=7141 RepID=A0ACC0KHA9_CHOFU|nr:hypothetical protein MSG28_003867 [Choristoneura fumiferana]
MWIAQAQHSHAAGRRPAALIFSLRPSRGTFYTVYVRHPELAAAKANRDYVLRAVCSAVDTIANVAVGRALPAPPPRRR